MLHIFRKHSNHSKVTFKIDGMHCTSCSMNIDGELEDTEGVISSSTSYASAKTDVEYDEKKVSLDTLQHVIEALDYKVTKL